MVNPLSRVNMENYLRDKKAPQTGLDKKKGEGNLPIGNREEDLLRELISGDRKIVEGGSRPRALSLDEAVDRIKNKGL